MRAHGKKLTLLSFYSSVNALVGTVNGRYFAGG